MTAEPPQPAAPDPVADGRRVVRIGTRARRRGAVAVVPGAEVAVMRLDLPRKLAGAAREQVARRQVGDLTGLPPESLDIRPIGGPGWSRVLVADAAAAAEWRRAAGRVRAVLPDYLALPAAEGLWSVAPGPGGVAVRLGTEDGFTCDPALVTPMLERAVEEGAPRAILHREPLLAGVAALAEAHGIPLVSDERDLAPHGIAPARLANGELALDLRRDPREARARLRRRVLPWRWPVLAALLAAGLWVAETVIATDRMDAQRRALAAATAETARRVVPTGPILDMRAQIAAALAGSGAGPGEDAAEGPGPLDTLGVAAEVLAARGASVSLLDYAASKGLEVVAVMPDFAALDALSEALAEAGLAVEVAMSRATEDGAEARILLGPGG